jgi:acyl carrier protein
MTELEKEIAQLIVDAVGLDQPASSIDPDAQLYGDALGLDSIDILEIAVVVAKRYGIEMNSEDAGNAKIFASLRALARHVAATRTR